MRHSEASSIIISYGHTKDISNLVPDNKVIAIIQFSQNCEEDPQDARRITVGLPLLESPNTIEVWYADRPVTAVCENDIACAFTEDVLFGHLLIDEKRFSSLAQATNYGYQRLQQCLKRRGFRYLLRLWNYFPRINLEENGLERYRSFCLGRYKALRGLDDFETSLPAASAIGTQANHLQIYFMAAKQRGIQIENPRQVSAFHYPKQYGPKSPSFSRAFLKHWGHHRHLYISGTASIKGYVSRHPNDLLTQTEETLDNIENLISHANEQEDLGIPGIGALSFFKVYMRGLEGVAEIKRIIRSRVSSKVPMLFLRGDLCRSDLLVEIESAYIEGHESTA
jgi:chorismate lyase/3-hydroxybenzoate synthase